MMYNSILFPTDGQPGSEQAREYALDLARQFDATVHTLYVIDAAASAGALRSNEQETLHERLETAGEQSTIDVQNHAADLDLNVSRQIREGRPDEAILDYADEHDVDLIVMGTRGRDTVGAYHLGSTTRRVLTRADVPVMTVAIDGDTAVSDTEYGTYDRVVIPTDGSDAAERAAEHALTIAEHYGADARVVYVVDSSTYGLQDAPRSIVGTLKEGGNNAVETIAALARERNVPVSTAILRGIPEESILQYVEGAEADLIAMGTRGHAGGGDRFLGSTTARVVRRSAVPVLTVR